MCNVGNVCQVPVDTDLHHRAEVSAALCVQSAKEYYEQALMQELKKNQELQEYLRLLENKIHQPKREGAADKQVSNSVTAAF